MRYLSLLVLLSVCCFHLTGCGVVSHYKAKDTSEVITNSLEVGMDKSQVRSLVGNPKEREFYGGKEIWFYKTKHFGTDHSMKESYTPIVFENNKVTEWGRKYYDDPNTQKIEADVTIRHK
jgi:outer membrane protein assembly factor BamE (lipoprotein component of BamABCDE complex)